MQAMILPDIYFQDAYHQLYAGRKAKVVSFEYHDNDKFFYLPGIQEAFDPALGVEGCDFQSAYGYGGPVTNCEAPEFLTAAWGHVMQEARQQGIAAMFIRFHPLLDNHRWVANQYAQNVQANNNVVIRSLQVSQQQVIDDYQANTRSNVHKAQREKVNIRVSVGDTYAMDIFMEMYQQTMERLKARDFYYFDRNYFYQLMQSLKDAVNVYLAYQGNTPVAGAIILKGEQFVHYHLSANLKEFRHLEAASLLRHQAIIDHLNKHWTWMLFGGGRSAQPDDALWLFKKGFSKEYNMFYTGKFIVDADLYARVCAAWENRYPQKKEAMAGYFLKYRM